MIPRLIQTYLPDGSLEGIKVIELSESPIKAFVVPRIKLSDVKKRSEINQPSLYLLINSSDNQLYIGESENFYHRVKNHDQSKDFWDLAIAIVSNTNSLEKSDVKYLESLAVEKAQATAAMTVLNKTVPARNNVHEFKVHTLEKILEDTAMIAESLGFSIFASKKDTEEESIWHLSAKKSNAKAQFRGDKFVILAGSIIDKSYAPSWAKAFPKSLVERDELLTANSKDLGDVFEVTNNISTRSPNHAGGLVSGRSINAWIGWKNKDGKTMDEVMRREEI
ncbi:GIY-YIG nuclease family protein [Candidatus Saccharibacteria bacterium]|nr:MAG: GIY-YIG nuclease family protein [Candidatus Saccharibacteria bacterium]